MTGKEVLRCAMQLMLIPDDSLADYTPFALPVINGLLPRLFSVNHLACLADGMKEEDIPKLCFLEDLQQHIPLRPEVAQVLPVGICAHLAAEDDDIRRSWFAQQYEEHLAAVSATCCTAVEEMY